MAKGDLYRLAVEARDFLQNQKAFRAELNKQTHVFSVDAVKVRNQAYIQLEKFHGTSKMELREKQKVSSLINQYVSSMYIKFKTKNVTVTGNSKKFTVEVSDYANNYAVIVEARTELQQWLTREINKVLNTDAFTSDSFLDTGHSIGVADKQVDKAFEKIRFANDTNTEVAKLLVNTMLLKVSSKFVGSSKEFIIQLSEEAATKNRSNAAQEKARRKNAELTLESFIRKHDWVNQKGSDSYKEFVINSVLNEAAKSKHFKGKAPKLNISPATASLSIKNESKRKVVRHTEHIDIVGQQRQKSSIDIISLLNAKLPEEVRKRMTYPRLVNRTGRFASSVRAVAETRTPSGALSIAYTYQRSPYQVFERTLGRAPWNTPEREPRDLINESIRAIAASVMTERFFTRRV
jgi:hypothetical protein